MNRQEVVEWAASYSDDETQEDIEELEKLLNSNIKITSYVLLGTSLLTLAIFQIGWWYRTTLILRAINNKYKRISGMVLGSFSHKLRNIFW